MFCALLRRSLLFILCTSTNRPVLAGHTQTNGDGAVIKQEQGALFKQLVSSGLGVDDYEPLPIKVHKDPCREFLKSSLPLTN